MKKIQFSKISIQNFKSIETLEIDFKEQTSVYGRNGSGKTSIADAIMFVLFNKDLDGNAPVKAGFKRVDANGNEIAELTMNVTLTLVVDGVPLILERKQVEKWQTKRGSNERVFVGNEQNLSVNETTVKTAEFEDAVNSVVNEELFRLLTNPHFFMYNIDQKKRRDMLMEFIGDRDAEIENNLKAMPKYASLVAEWDTDMNRMKVFNSFVEWLTKKSKADNEELKAIPEKVQALQLAIGEVIDAEKIKALVAGYNKEIDKIDENLNKPVDIPEWVAEYEAKANDLKQKSNADKTASYNEAVQKVSSGIQERNKVEQELARLEVNFTLASNDHSASEKKIPILAGEREALILKWNELSSKKFEAPSVDEVCSHCGQKLPSDQIEDHIEKSRLAFEKENQSKIAEVVEAGAEKKKQLDDETEKMITAGKKIEALTIEINTVKATLEATPKVDMPTMSDTETSIKLNAEADELLAKVTEYRTADTSKRDNSELISQKSSYRMMIDDANKKLGQIEQQEVIRGQIASLHEKEEKLRELKVHYEVLMNLSDEFTRDKNMAFEEELSKHFTHIKWQLFEAQANGGYKQVCEPLYNGRNWTQQSLGEQIFTGIDIIKAFSEKKLCQAPIIIDNRESLTLPLELEVQTISMYADDKYEELTVS